MPGPQSDPCQVLLAAYRDGYFPMADPDLPGAPFHWFNPDPRAIIPLSESEGLHIPRRLRERARSGRFEITSDAAFEHVIRACAAPRRSSPSRSESSWIDPRIIALYTALHRAGHAHSIEARLSPPSTSSVRPSVPSSLPLVGGLYGVHIGSAFFAESKFSRPDLGGTDASKVCLYHLIAHLRRRGFTLLDVQFQNPHLRQFGSVEIPRANYLSRLAAAAGRQIPWLPFNPTPDL